MTPSRTATQQGQEPFIIFAQREPKMLQNTLKRRASKQAVQKGIKRGSE